MNKYTISLLILIVVVIVAGIGVVLFYDKPAPPEQPNGQVDPPDVIVSDVDTSKWEMYKSEELGFEIKYPSGWRLTEDNNQVVIGFPDWREGLPEGGTALDIKLEDITLGDFINEYREQDLQEDGFSMSEIGSIEDYILDEHPVRKLTGSTGLGIDRNFIFAEINGSALIISFHDFDESHVDIISTFKFIDK